MDENVTIEGMEETLAAFDRLSDAMAHEALQPALIAAAVPVMETLAARTPVRTGDLLQDMKMSIKVDAHEGEVQVGFPNNQHLVRWLEYGHREVGHAPLHREIGNVDPHPFMRPTAEEAAEPALEAFKTTLDEKMDELAEKVGLSDSQAA